MTKIKTRRSAIKRYKVTGNKKYIRKRAFGAHLLEKKSSSRKRRLCSSITVSASESLVVRKFFNQ